MYLAGISSFSLRKSVNIQQKPSGFRENILFSILLHFLIRILLHTGASNQRLRHFFLAWLNYADNNDAKFKSKLQSTIFILIMKITVILIFQMTTMLVSEA